MLGFMRSAAVEVADVGRHRQRRPAGQHPHARVRRPRRRARAGDARRDPGRSARRARGRRLGGPLPRLARGPLHHRTDAGDRRRAGSPRERLSGTSRGWDRGLRLATGPPPHRQTGPHRYISGDFASLCTALTRLTVHDSRWAWPNVSPAQGFAFSSLPTRAPAGITLRVRRVPASRRCARRRSETGWLRLAAKATSLYS